MFKDLFFCNNGILSPMDMTTMGDSSKREDALKIGKFDSGLKYALAILTRNGVAVSIVSGGVDYSFSSVVQHDEMTGKTKEVLQVVSVVDGIEKTTITGFALNLGHDWEFWMAIRELYSNCLDEGGVKSFDTPQDNYDTIIHISGCELIQAIIDDWSSYFIDEITPLFELSSVSIYPNPTGTLKVYKNGILVYRNESKQSKYVYDYPFADIDEMRVMKGTRNFEWAISRSVCSSNNIDFIQTFFNKESYQFESLLTIDDTLSDEWVEYANSQYEENGFIEVWDNILSNLKTDTRVDVGARIVATQETNYYSRTVEVKTPVKEESVILSFEDKVKSICKQSGVNVELPIVISNIDGVSCVGDIYNKVIYVTESFGESDVWELLKAQYRVIHKSNQDQVYKDFVETLKKRK